MQHEGEPLGRGERLEHDLQRDPDGVREQRFVLGIRAGRRIADDGLQPEPVQRILAAGPAKAQHVQTDAGDDRRQPPLQAVDLRGVGPPQP